MSRIVIWRISPGKKIGQESQDIKYQEGMEYIERLKNEGENVLSVENQGNQLKITLE